MVLGFQVDNEIAGIESLPASSVTRDRLFTYITDGISRIVCQEIESQIGNLFTWLAAMT